MKNTPIERNVIDETINEFQIVDFSKATIREVKAIASKAEAVSGVEFIKMEMAACIPISTDCRNSKKKRPTLSKHSSM